MDKKELVLTVAKDIYIERVKQSSDIKSLLDAVRIVEDAYASIKD